MKGGLFQISRGPKIRS